MIEEIDTNSNFSDKELPDGENVFRVMVGSPRKVGSTYYWMFSYDNGQKQGEIGFFANNMGPLLKVLGCKESDGKKGVYVFNSDELEGVSFKATVYRVVDKKDPSKIYQRMKDFDEVPF